MKPAGSNIAEHQRRDDVLRAMAPKHTRTEIAKVLGCTEDTVSVRLKRLNLRAVKRKPGRAGMTEAVREQIIAVAATTTVPEMAERFGVGKPLIYSILQTAKTKFKQIGSCTTRAQREAKDRRALELAPTHTAQGIADDIGEPRRTTWARLKRLGVKAVHHSSGRVGPPEAVRERVRALAPTHTVREIGRDVGLRATAVRNLLQKLHITAKRSVRPCRPKPPRKAPVPKQVQAPVLSPAERSARRLGVPVACLDDYRLFRRKGCSAAEAQRLVLDDVARGQGHAGRVA